MSFACSAGAVSLLVCSVVIADTANSPDPYGAGSGFDTPTEAGWGLDRLANGGRWVHRF
jgi:hypothetical protein